MPRPSFRALLAALLLVPHVAFADAVDRVAAVVNEDLIIWSEIYELAGAHVEERTGAEGGTEKARRGAELEVLEIMIGRRLVTQEMTRLGLDVTDADLERALGDVARQNGLDRDQLRTEVERSGLAWDSYLSEFRENLREMKFSQQILAPRISIRDDELLDLYRRNGAAMAGPPRARLQAILVPVGDSPEAALERALALRQEILAGQTFESVAAKHSAEPYASMKGAMGVFQAGDLTPALNTPAFSLPVGGVSEPIVTPQGVYLLRVVEHIAQALPPFDNVKEALQQQLMEMKVVEARDQWLAQARRRASVKVLLEHVP